MWKVEAVVVGAGVVGLAIARALALRGLEVLVLDKERGIGRGISSRSSEVIHAGIYYPVDSLKARLCVAGRRALYDYCDARGVSYRRCGKLVVASYVNEEAELTKLAARAVANGVEDVSLISGEDMRRLEPDLSGTGALFSRNSGIVDSRALMLAYQADAEAAGTTVVLRTPVVEGRLSGNAIHLITGGSPPGEIEAALVVNAAGLDAWELSSRLKGLDARTIPPRYFAKGSYFTLTGRIPFQRLIYPVPEQAGLGIHLTLDMAGQARFGPDLEWVDHVSYDVNPLREESFYAAIRRYWPGIPSGSLTPAHAGIRAKTSPPGTFSDFVIQCPRETGHKGYVALYGIESPGLTASLAIADYVDALASGSLAGRV